MRKLLVPFIFIVTFMSLVWWVGSINQKKYEADLAVFKQNCNKKDFVIKFRRFTGYYCHSKDSRIDFFE